MKQENFGMDKLYMFYGNKEDDIVEVLVAKNNKCDNILKPREIFAL